MELRRVILLIAASLCVAQAYAFTPVQIADDSYQADLLQKVSIFPGDNRGPISVRGPEEGLRAHDIQRAKENIGNIFCPSHVPGKFRITVASLIGSNDQIVTNAHALLDDNGVLYDPISKCVFMQTALDDKRRLIEHALFLKDGKYGLDALLLNGTLKIGSYIGHKGSGQDRTDDYAIIKLLKPIDWVRPYKTGLSSLTFHGCREEQLCQRLVSITNRRTDDMTGIKMNRLIIQSSDLRGFLSKKGENESSMYSDTSAIHGYSLKNPLILRNHNQG